MEASIEALINYVIMNPDMSFRQHARKMVVHDFTICEDLRKYEFKIYVRRKQQLITEAVNSGRAGSSGAISCSHGSGIIFTTSFFTLVRDDIKCICKTKHPRQMMVLGISGILGIEIHIHWFFCLNIR